MTAGRGDSSAAAMKSSPMRSAGWSEVRDTPFSVGAPLRSAPAVQTHPAVPVSSLRPLCRARSRLPIRRSAGCWMPSSSARLLGRTIVVLAGDHGESLGEHGETDHGIFVYENVLRVPLIIRLPGDSPKPVRRPSTGRRYRPPGRCHADRARSPRPDDALEQRRAPDRRRQPGRPDAWNLADLGARSLRRVAVPTRFGWSPLKTLQEGRFKLIDAPRPELYDLDRDPFEERNIHAERHHRRGRDEAAADSDGQ